MKTGRDGGGEEAGRDVCRELPDGNGEGIGTEMECERKCLLVEIICISH